MEDGARTESAEKMTTPSLFWFRVGLLSIVAAALLVTVAFAKHSLPKRARVCPQSEIPKALVTISATANGAPLWNRKILSSEEFKSYVVKAVKMGGVAFYIDQHPGDGSAANLAQMAQRQGAVILDCWPTAVP